MIMMKTAILALTTLVIASGSAFAAPSKQWNRGHDGRGNVTPYERMAIVRASNKLATVKRQALRDGKISFFERIQIRNAEKQYFAALARAHRS
jgi:hypothetical protein